jgi:hypothetical protein
VAIGSAFIPPVSAGCISLLGVGSFNRIRAPSSYTGPGDLKTFAFWGGFRAYSAATAGTKAVQLQRSDSTVTDINTLADGSFDTASAATFCTATTCKVRILYDKSGNANDMQNGNFASMPFYTVSAIGAHPAMSCVSASSTGLQAL